MKEIYDSGDFDKWVFELSSDKQYLTIYLQDAIESLRVKKSIKFKRIGTSEKTTQTALELLRGVWYCKKNAYGKPWDDTEDRVLKAVFSASDVEMDWYNGAVYDKRYLWKYFVIIDNKIDIYGDKYNYTDLTSLNYKLTNDNNTLTIYGLDKNDMAELTFERAK